MKTREGGETRGTYYRKTLGPWVRIIGNDVTLAQVNAEMVDYYVETRRGEGVTDHTISKEWTAVKQALQLAKRGGAFPGDVDSLRPPDLHQSYTPRSRALKPHELTALLTELEGDRAAFVVLCATLGLRKGEAEGLLPSDIDLAAGLVHVRGTKTEGSDRVVAIIPQWRELTERALAMVPIRPWHTGACVRDMAAACRRAKIDRCTPNDLRRTFATLLVSGGVSLDTTRRLLGHSSTAMVERVYGRPDPVAVGVLAASGDLPSLGGSASETVQKRHTPPASTRNPAPPTRFERVTFRLGSDSGTAGNAEIRTESTAGAGWSRLETAGAGGGTVQRRHTPESWSLAYAYRDVLSRRAAA